MAKPATKPSAGAQAKYNSAVAHYQAKEFAEACTDFQAAYDLKPTSQWLFNLASACRLAGQDKQALDAYKKYLEENPDAANREQVEKRIAELDAKLAPPPPPPPAPEPEPTPIAKPEPAPKRAPKAATDKPWNPGTPKTPYEVGVRTRYLFVTNLMLKPYLDAATQMFNSFSVGAEFVYHRKNFDVVTSLDFSYLGVDDGNYLTHNHDPSLDTHYVQFRKLSFISADVSIIGHHDFNRWVQIRGGAGLGVGAVLGNVLITNNSTACTKQNASNPTECHPALAGWDANNPDPSLKASENGATKDTAQNPHRHKASEKPPAMGVLNILIGVRLNLPQQFTFDVELGFRDAMFVGIAAHRRF